MLSLRTFAPGELPSKYCIRPIYTRIEWGELEEERGRGRWYGTMVKYINMCLKCFMRHKYSRWERMGSGGRRVSQCRLCDITSPWQTKEEGDSPGWTRAVMNTNLQRVPGSRFFGEVIVRRSRRLFCWWGKREGRREREREHLNTGRKVADYKQVCICLLTTLWQSRLLE